MTVQDFNEEVLPLKDKLYRFARRLLNAHEEAEDVVQDVLIKLWTKKETLKTYQNVEAFAMTVTKNLCFDRLKSGRRNAASHEMPDSASSAPSPLIKIETLDSIALMNQIINELSDMQKMIVQLRDIEEMEFEEIMEITGLKMNAVRTNLSRARQKIRIELNKAYEYGLNTS